MHAPLLRRSGYGIVLDEAVQEGGVALVADAVHVPARLGRVAGVEGRQLDCVAAGRGEDAFCFAERTGYWDRGVGDVGEFPAHELGAAAAGVVAYVAEGCGGGAFEVVVVETLEDVEVLVAWDVGYDVCFPRFGFRWLFPRIDGVESEERIRFIDTYQSLAVATVNHKPLVGPVGVEFHGVKDVPCP